MEVTSLLGSPAVIIPTITGILTWLRPASNVCPPCSVTCPQVTCGSLTCSGSPSTTTGLSFIAIAIALAAGLCLGTVVRVPIAWSERAPRRVENKTLPFTAALGGLTDPSTEQSLTITPKTRIR